MAVSQKQIAERLGVSIALVSRVLSGKARDVGIADATIERVLSAAREMGYVPSAAALTLKGKATRTVGVVVYDFKDPFFASMIEDLQAEARRHDHSLILSGFKKREPDPADLAPLRKHAIDGLIILGSDEHADWLSAFSAMPVVRLGHGSPREESMRISIDEVDAARQIVDYAARASERDLVFVREDFPAHRLREKALAEAAKSVGRRFRCEVSRDWAFQAGLRETERLLERGAGETLLCATDKIAMGALHAMHQRDEWLPVIGFDDIPTSEQFLPPITTLRQPIEEMALRAFDAILNPSGSGEILLSGSLVIRKSA